MFRNHNDQIKYIEENFTEVTDSRIDDSHWDIYCDHCKIVRGFQVIKRESTSLTTYYSSNIDWDAPHTIYFHCPVCKAYKIWIVFNIRYSREVKGGTTSITKIYRVTSIPNNGLDEIQELPEDPKDLRIAYRQAIRSMDANAEVASAAMFRRAVQVITRQILNIQPSSLANELKACVGKSYNGITLTNNFADNGYILKEAGNQGAHPDADPDLLDFTQKDATDLQTIFMELVQELFIVPEAIRKTKEDFKKRRKII